MDSATLTTRSQNLLAAIREAIEKGNKQPRWPKGHPNGGQWKPTGAGGIGTGQGSMFDNPYLKNKMKEAESALGEAKGLLGAGVATAGAIAGATAGAGLAGTAGAVIGGKVGQAIGEKAAEGLGLTATHAQPGPGGKPIKINNPSTASSPDTWRDSKASATWTPKSDTPDQLNGISVKPWKAPKTDAEWNAVEGQMTLPEPPLPQAMDSLGNPKRPGAGVVITEPDGRVWIVKPTNEFGGYKHSYPKGGQESGIASLQANAIKEAWEESGLKVEINGILGDYEGDTSIARYYTASRTGGSPADMGWETQATLLVPASELKTYLNRSRDRQIADDLVARLGRQVGKSDIAKRIQALMEAIELEKGDPNQPRYPKGHPRGGQWKPTGAGGVSGAGAAGGAAGLPKEPFKPSFATGANPNNGALKAANKAIQKYADMANAGDVAGLLAAKPTDPGTVKGPNSYMKKKWGEWHNAHDYAKGVQSTGAGPTSTPETRRESGPMKLSGLTFVKDKAAIGGSNPGILGKDKAGNEWLVKGSNLGDTEGPPGGAARNEVLASRLYNAAGAVAPEMRLVDVDTPGGVNKLKTETAVASKMMDVKPFKASNPAHVEAAKKDFAIDAWLGSIDVLGMSNDNVMVAKDGSVVRIDPGGTMFYRAQGGLKKFTKDATEWDTMRGPTKDFNPGQTPSTWPIFGKMTDSELKASAEKLKSIDDATIKALVEKHGPTSVTQAELTDILIARKQDILKRAGLTDEAPPKGDNADLLGLFLGPENGGVDAPAAPKPDAPSKAAAAETNALTEKQTSTIDASIRDYEDNAPFLIEDYLKTVIDPKNTTYTPDTKHYAKMLWDVHVKKPVPFEVKAPEAPAAAAAATGIPKPKITGDLKNADVDTIHAALQTGNADAIASYTPKTYFGEHYQAAALVALGAGDKRLGSEGIKFTAQEIWDSAKTSSGTSTKIAELGDPSTWIKTPAQAAQAGVSLPKKPAFDRDNDYFLGVKVDNLEAAAKKGDTGTAAQHAADIVTTWESVKSSGDPSPALTAASNYAKATMAALGIAEDGSKIEPKAPDAPLTKPRAPKTASTEVAQQLKALDDIVRENPGEKVVSNYLASVANPKTTDYAPEVKAYAQSLLDYQKAGGDLWADASPKTAPALPNKLPSTKKSELPQPTKYGLSLSDPIGTALLDLAASGEYGTLKNVDLGTLPDSMKQYKQALLSTLEGKWGNQYGSGTGAGTASVTQTATTALGAQVRTKSAAPPALPAKPPIGALSSAANPNKGLIGKVDQIEQWADAAIKGTADPAEAFTKIHATTFGSNSFAKKAKKYQADVLASLKGMTDSGVKPQAQPTTKPTPTAAAAKAKAVKPKVTPKLDPNRLMEPPDFFKNGNQGPDNKWMSSKKEINEANNAEVKALHDLAKTFNLEALKAYPIKSPSQHVNSYKQMLIEDVGLQLNPPPKLSSIRTEGGAKINDAIAQLSASAQALKSPQEISHKIGFYPVLGKTRNAEQYALPQIAKWGAGLNEKTYAKASLDNFNTLSSTKQKAIADYTGSSYNPINESFRAGTPNKKGLDADAGIRESGVELKPGTVISRKIYMSGKQHDDFLKHGTGKVIQEFGISSTSVDPATWSGNIHLRMTTGRGVKGIYVGNNTGIPGHGAISKNPGEKEILLPANTRMLITKIHQPGKQKDGYGQSGMPVVDVLVLPTPT